MFEARAYENFENEKSVTSCFKIFPAWQKQSQQLQTFIGK